MLQKKKDFFLGVIKEIRRNFHILRYKRHGSDSSMLNLTAVLKYFFSTVCPGSSDPPEKNILIYLHQKIRFTHFFLTIMIF